MTRKRDLLWWQQKPEFFIPDPGEHALRITGLPVAKTLSGRRVVEIPTDSGKFTTSALSILQPLARLLRSLEEIRKVNTLTELVSAYTLRFLAVGDGKDRRYEKVSLTRLAP